MDGIGLGGFYDSHEFCISEMVCRVVLAFEVRYNDDI